MEEENFPDATDWAHTSIPGLQAVETSLRCQVCKEFFTGAKTTSCGHTFCSLCIRRCLTLTSKCPTCMKSGTEHELRDNIVVSDLVNSFNLIRKQMLEALVKKEEEVVVVEQEEEEAAAEDMQNGGADRKAEKRSSYDIEDEDEEMMDIEVSSRRRGKRRRHDETPSSSQRTPEGLRRSSRASSQRTNSKMSSQPIVIDDSDGEFQPIEDVSEDEFQSGSRSKKKSISRIPETPTKKDVGPGQCPVCWRVKTEATIAAHVNRCLEGNRSPSPTPKRTNGASSAGSPLKRKPVSFANITKTHRDAYTDEEKQSLRIPKLSFSMMKDTELRKRLKDQGLRYDVKGKESKQVLLGRLQEWTNIWNANLDAQRPKMKTALIKDLEAYERSQQNQKPSVVQDKGFEREAWGQNHRNEFDNLVASARKSAAKKQENGETTDEASKPSEETPGETTEIAGIRSPESTEA